MGTSPSLLARLALCLSLAALSACGPSSHYVHQYEKELVVNITGGSSCNPPGLEAVGAIVRRDQRTMCSGTLIANDTILTAAHCLEGEEPANLSFVIGADLRTAVSHPIASGVPHPEYRKGKHGSHDIALLYLREPVPGVTPVPYRKASLPVYFRGRLTFVGFGDDDGTAQTGSGIKRCLRVHVSRVNEFTFENNTPGHTTCHGDSGGPVLDYRDGKWEIVGLIASGDSLCKRLGLSSRVDVAAEWITQTVPPSRVTTVPGA